METIFLAGPVVTGQGVMVLNCSPDELVADLEAKWGNRVFRIWWYWHRKNDGESYPEFHITCWNTINLLTTSATALTITQDNGSITSMHLKVFYSFASFSNFIGEQNVLTVTYWVCLQDTERPLDHLFSFSSPLISIWEKKKKGGGERKTVWHFFMIPLIFYVVTILIMVQPFLPEALVHKHTFPYLLSSLITRSHCCHAPSQLL